jgi:Methyltransferase domain
MYHKTAIKRKNISVPLRWLISKGLLFGKTLDYGCGRGFDCSFLGIQGYDPNAPAPINKYPTCKFNTVICTYVLNVLPPKEQREVIRSIKKLLTPNGVAYVTVRRDIEENKKGPNQWFVALPEKYKLRETSSYCIYKIPA